VSQRERGGAYVSFDEFLTRLHRQPLNSRAVRNLVMVGTFNALAEPRCESCSGAGRSARAQSTAAKSRFFTLEEEHGHINVTIRPDVYQRYRREAAQPILVIAGAVQSHDGV
jgi:DNA polymerase III alpha subunit